ncbi:MAG: hypothetical protein H7Z43_00585 [Clostridia bacterium]|nr:hypothetical protein [Deltaproteobacteria bacterium]
MFGLLALAFVAAPSWQVDPDYRTHLAYLAHDLSGSITETRTLANVPGYQPDITNIIYRDFRQLGMPVPARANEDQLKLYLKLLNWPAGLDSEISARKTFAPFLMFDIPGGEALEAFIAKPGNVILKLAVIDTINRAFTADRPLKATISKSRGAIEAMMPFSTIYVKPVQSVTAKTDSERARASTAGVIAVHRALLAAYEETFTKFGEDSTTVYFAELRHAKSESAITGARVFAIARQPLVFDTFRDLPMPQDPKNVFLSALLLVKLTDYAAPTPVTQVQLDDVLAWHEVWSHMLEVGSIYDRRRH